MSELMHGDWHDHHRALGQWDALISDPPYGERTHAKQRHGRIGDDRSGNKVKWCFNNGLEYDALTPADVEHIVAELEPRTLGWFCVFTCSGLFGAWRAALEAAGRYVFAPVACVMHGMNVRLAGDGPSNWTVYLCVARPRTMPYCKWGTLPGAYVGQPFDVNSQDRTRPGSVKGAKPLWLMRAVIRDYTRQGDRVFDPFAGGGTTLLACDELGRKGFGCEIRGEAYQAAQKRLRAGVTLDMFPGEPKHSLALTLVSRRENAGKHAEGAADQETGEHK